MTRRAGSCQRGGFSSITWREIWTTTRKGSECRRSFMVGKLFRRQADRGRWGGRGRALDSFRKSMAIQIVIEEWEGSRKRVQTSILPTPMWLLLYVRSVWSPVLLEVSVSAPYVCKYKALPQLWGPGMDGTWGCHFCEEVKIRKTGRSKKQAEGSVQACFGRTPTLKRPA